jgi:hypothetical protein
MAPSITECLNMLEAITKSLQEELAAQCAAMDEKFATLKKSVKDESAAIRAEIGMIQTAIQAELSTNQAALIALLMPQHQNAELPQVLLMPNKRSALSTPDDPA